MQWLWQRGTFVMMEAWLYCPSRCGQMLMVNGKTRLWSTDWHLPLGWWCQVPVPLCDLGEIQLPTAWILQLFSRPKLCLKFGKCPWKYLKSSNIPIIYINLTAHDNTSEPTFLQLGAWYRKSQYSSVYSLAAGGCWTIELSWASSSLCHAVLVVD